MSDIDKQLDEIEVRHTYYELGDPVELKIKLDTKAKAKLKQLIVGARKDMLDEPRQHNKLDDIMTAALIREHPEWDMETIREAALICSNSLIQEPDATFVKNNTELHRILDKYGRELTVSGLDHRGFSTSAQKILKKLEAALNAYIGSHYRSVEEIEAAIGEDELDKGRIFDLLVAGRNELRAEIRKALGLEG